MHVPSVPPPAREENPTAVELVRSSVTLGDSLDLILLLDGIGVARSAL